LGARHREYYKGADERIDFESNNVPFSISIKDVSIYPQAFAAAVTIHDEVSMYKIINIVYVGGYTVDLLQLTDFKPDMTLCTCLLMGLRVTTIRGKIWLGQLVKLLMCKNHSLSR